MTTKWLKQLMASSAVALPLLFDMPGAPVPMQAAHAAGIATLADVGLREYLVKDGRQWLRLSIPVGKDMKIGIAAQDDELKLAQEGIEIVRLRLEQVGFSNKAVWGGCVKDATTADNLIKKNRDRLISEAITRGSGQADPQSLVDDKLLPTMANLIAALRAQDITSTNVLQESAGAQLANLRMMQLPSGKLPFQIPDEYASLPRLNGRAEIEMVVQSAGGKPYRLADEVTLVPKVTLRLVVDGYHAPLTSGNFVDLVRKGFYDGMTLQKVEQLIVQTGKPSNGGDGPRKIPLEIFYKLDKEPSYSATSDDEMRATDAIALPFQAYGAIGMARQNEDVDSASSQFFLLKWDQALVAPGRNTLDGFYTNMGYVTENEQLLSQFQETDKVVSMKVVKGLENLVVP
jgi:cyclophilin family peptidyl-prolyl cis-trans isomerase